VAGDRKSDWPGWALWLATMVGVPAAVIGSTRWTVLTRHPVLTVAFLVSCAAVGILVGIVRKLWQDAYEARFLTWIAQGIDIRLSRFDHAYREHVCTLVRLVDLKGLGSQSYTPELSDVYINIGLQTQNPRYVPASDLGDHSADPAQRLTYTDFLGHTQPSTVAVIGAPGSGKSTLLRSMAYELCRTGGRKHRRHVPILLILRDHVSSVLVDNTVPLPDLVRSTLDPYGLAEPKGWFERHLRAGRCLVMFDGLDGVAKDSDRRAMSDWMSMQRRRYPRNDFVVTARPYAYRSAPLEGAVVVRTQPLSSEQVSRFIDTWFLTVRRHTTRLQGGALERFAMVDTVSLRDQLRKSSALRELTVNPLLLTMISIVHLQRGILPQNRAELYRQICSVLLWQRRPDMQSGDEYTGNQRELLSQTLAYEMMHRRTPDIRSGDAIAVLAPVLRRIGKRITAENFLTEVEANGLFIQRKPEIWSFAHPTFQEYLASAHIRTRNLEETLLRQIGDSWWHETILLYVAGADASSVVRECLSKNTVNSLSLAFDCALEAAELDETLRASLDSLIEVGLAHDADVGRRRLILAALLVQAARRTGQSGFGLIDQPVSWELYQHFVSDMSGLGESFLPDNPAAAGRRTDTVRGLRASDAIAFVEWANELTGEKEIQFRLPILAELEGRSLQRTTSNESVWYQETAAEGAPVALWTSPGAQSPYVLTGRQIRVSIAADLQSHKRTIALLLLRHALERTITIHSVIGIQGRGAYAMDLNKAYKSAEEVARILEVAGGLGVDMDSQLLSAAQTVARSGPQMVGSGRRANPAYLLTAAFKRTDPEIHADVLDLLEALSRICGDLLSENAGSLLEHVLLLEYADADTLLSLVTHICQYGREAAERFQVGHSEDIEHARCLDSAVQQARNHSAFGSILADSIRVFWDGPRDLESGLSGFIGRFSAIIKDDDNMAIDPKSLTFSVAREIADRLGVTETTGWNQAPDWVQRTAEHLEATALSLRGREPVSTEKATAIRLAALVLATETRAQWPDISLKLLQMASTVTWLQLRESGEIIPTETLILALK